LLSGSVEELSVNFKLGFDERRAYTAVLRIAFLAMFKELGYRYTLSPAAGVIRSIICNVDNAPTNLGRIVAEAKNIAPLPAEPWQLLSAGGGRVVMLIATLRADSRRHYVTFMPSPELIPTDVMPTLFSVAEEIGRQMNQT
jgi:hypothetical protein